LVGYDYSQNGCYFVTIDIQDKLRLFWDEKEVSEIGRMVEKIICEIPIFYKGVSVGEYVVMPDHVHIILIIDDVGADPCIRPISINPIECVGADPCIRPKMGQTQGSARTFGQKLSLSEVVQRFKALTTRRYIDGVRSNNWPKFHKRLWQRNYFERIVQDEFELARTRKYIEDNPKRYLVNGRRGVASSKYLPK